MSLLLFIFFFPLGAHSRLGTTAVQRTFRLKKVIKHERFSMRHLRNDIALLQLSGSVTPSSKVNVVCLPQKGSTAQIGKQCYITGWHSKSALLK